MITESERLTRLADDYLKLTRSLDDPFEKLNRVSMYLLDHGEYELLAQSTAVLAAVRAFQAKVMDRRQQFVRDAAMEKSIES